MRFFSQFPKVNYNIGADQTETSLVDIYRHVDVNKTLIDDLTSYTYYNIKDGERPDALSFKLYGSPDYHWTFFIINESLKNGLDGWPRSYNEQQDYIEKKYDHCSVMEFLPTQSLVTVGDEDKIKYENFFDGIEFDTEHVILKDDNGESATIVRYDPSRLQAWIKDLSNTTFLSNDTTQYTIDSKLTGTERDDWLTNVMVPFVEKNHPLIYKTLIEDTRLVIDNILPYLRGSRDDSVEELIYSNDYVSGEINSGDWTVSPDFEVSEVTPFANDTVESLLDTIYLSQIKFTTSRSWLKSYNAPYEYYDSNEEFINAYDKLKLEPNTNDYNTYYQAEEEENEIKSRIRILRDTDVEPFAEYYKELINE